MEKMRRRLRKPSMHRQQASVTGSMEPDSPKRCSRLEGIHKKRAPQ
jgi:hypothetical protein